MGRRTSWINKLPDIMRSVHKSARSHYERKDIEQLFGIHPRSAQQLMKTISVGARIGRSLLVERQTLEEFLAHVAESADPEKAMQSFRLAETPIPRKRLHHLIQQDEIPATLSTLPLSVKLERGLLQITFTDFADLARCLYRLAQAMDADVERCMERLNPTQTVIEDPVVDDVKSAFADLKELKRKKKLLSESSSDHVE